MRAQRREPLWEQGPWKGSVSQKGARQGALRGGLGLGGEFRGSAGAQGSCKGEQELCWGFWGMVAPHHEKRGPQGEGPQGRGVGFVREWECGRGSAGGLGFVGIVRVLRAQRLRGENMGSVRRPRLNGRGHCYVRDRLREKCWLLKRWDLSEENGGDLLLRLFLPNPSPGCPILAWLILAIGLSPWSTQSCSPKGPSAPPLTHPHISSRLSPKSSTNYLMNAPACTHSL